MSSPRRSPRAWRLWGPGDAAPGASAAATTCSASSAAAAWRASTACSTTAAGASSRSSSCGAAATSSTHARARALFEREFHTLAQLVAPARDRGLRLRHRRRPAPFYTMELLDGGDLRERSPLPWREACALLLDVCSSLALLHSRRLRAPRHQPAQRALHRDGHAKLIDFGAMVPMGPGGAGRRHAAVRRARGRAPLDARRAHRPVLARRDALLRADRAHAVSGARLRRAARGVERAAAAALAARRRTSRRRSTRW